MPSIPLSQTAFLLIDAQRGFFEDTNKYFGEPFTAERGELFKKNTIRLLEEFRKETPEGKPFVIHVHHSSRGVESLLHPSHPTHQVLPYAAPIEGEPLWYKDVNSAFVNTPAEQYLRDRKIRRLVIAGLTTDHCVSTSTRMANNLDIVNNPEWGQGEILFVKDATAANGKGGFDSELIHAVQLASLNGEFATVVDTDEVIRLLRE